MADPFAEHAPVVEPMDMDQILSMEYDDATVQRTRQDALSPAGSYRTIPALTFTAKVHEKTGRPMLRFYGLAASVKDETVTGRFGFQMSPQRANKVDRVSGEDTGKPDLSSVLYEQASKAYTLALGEKPKTVAQLAEFIRDYPLNLRVIQVGVPTVSNPEPDGEASNIVMGLSYPRD